MRVELALMLGAFALATLVAEALGAVNTGTAMTFGILAFAATAVWVMVKRGAD
jgi:hypothetical protein